MADHTITSRSRAHPTSITANEDGSRASARGSSATSSVAASAVEEQTIKGRGAIATKTVGGVKGHARPGAVTSESWDDDFLFQHSSTSDLHLPLSSAASSSRPSYSSSSRHASTSSSPPSTPSRSCLAPPSPARQTPWLRPNANPSLDSLASSAWDSEDTDPTLTLPHRHHTPTGSIGGATITISSSSQSTTPRRARAPPSPQAPRTAPRPRRLHHQEDHDLRSTMTTPSLSSTTGAATAEELTEAESFLSQSDVDFDDDDGGQRTSVEVEGDRPDWARPSAAAKEKERRRDSRRTEGEGEMAPPPVPRPSSRSSSGGGGSKKWTTSLGLGLFGSNNSTSRPAPVTVTGETGLPSPSSPQQLPPGAVILERRRRGGVRENAAEPDQSAWRRRPHSSLESNTSFTSTASNSTADSINYHDPSSTEPKRSRRLSLDFLYRSRSSRAKRASSSSFTDGPPLSPSASFFLSSSTSSRPPSSPKDQPWREYEDSAASATEGEGELASAGEDGLSGDEEVGRVVRLGGEKGMRKSILTPSTSWTGTIGGSGSGSAHQQPQGRWTGSQVSFASFASSASAFGLPHSSTSGGAAGYDQAPERRRRKLVRRRSSGKEEVGAKEEQAQGERPLLSASSSLRSGTTSGPQSANLDGSFGAQREEAMEMAFARESGDEGTARGPRGGGGWRSPSRRPTTATTTTTTTGRQRSATAGSVPLSHQPNRGSVIELDPDSDGGWLAVAPFPRSASTSSFGPLPTSNTPATLTPSRSTPSLSKSLSASSPAATVRNLLRRSSGKSKSKPPVTGKTQAALRGASEEELPVKKERKRPPLSLSNLLSRSASSLPLSAGGGSKRAPSPAPTTSTTTSGRSSIISRSKRSDSSKSLAGSPSPRPTSPTPPTPTLPNLAGRPSTLHRNHSLRAPTPTSTSSSPSSPAAPNSTLQSPRLLHRHSASVEIANQSPFSASKAAISRSESTTSFLSRARVFSKPSPSTLTSSTPSPPILTPALTYSSRPPPTTATKRSHRTSLQSISGSPSDARRPAPSSAPTSAPQRGRLNERWKMPTSTSSATQPRPQSTVSTISDLSETSTVRPRLLSGSSARALAFLDTKPMITVADGSWARRNREGGLAVGGGGKGHRPSLSLSSAMPSRPASYASVAASRREGSEERLAPYPRPRTSMAIDRPMSQWTEFEDGINGVDGLGAGGVARRNSLSDLRIPARITSSQRRIEEDLERVKEFAKGVEDLKVLRAQYQHLIRTAISPPASPEPGATSNSSPSLPSLPSTTALSKLALHIRRIEMEYEPWWEQAEALVDLGDGKPVKSPGKARETPAELASRRDRCVSLAPSTPRTGSSNAEEEEIRSSPTPTLASAPISRPNSTHLLPRRPSASSIETGLSVEERQKEMLRGVLLNPAHKGASLPSRGPPSPRPGLSILTNARSSSTPADSPVKPPPFGLSSSTNAASPASPYPPSTIAASSPSKTNLRRVSRAGVSGIKDFLLRLRLKASEELAASVNTPQLNQLARGAGAAPEDARRSVSDPTRSLTPSSSHYGSLRRRQPPSSTLQTPPKQQRYSRAGSSSSEEEDWDKESSPPSALGTISAAGGGGGRAMMVRTRTQSSAGGVEAGERMVLTTEAMPSLLLKVGEVKERCEECVGRLKGLTV